MDEKPADLNTKKLETVWKVDFLKIGSYESETLRFLNQAKTGWILGANQTLKRKTCRP